MTTMHIKMKGGLSFHSKYNVKHSPVELQF